MSIIYDCDIGCFISTEEFINSVSTSFNHIPKINGNLFKIISPYSSKNVSKRKSLKKFENQTNIEKQKMDEFQDLKKTSLLVQEKYSQLLPMIQTFGFLRESIDLSKNRTALKIAEFVYEESGKNIVKNALGSNCGPATIKHIQNSKYIFPRDCTFFSKDVSEIETQLQDKKFDLILLDPPWWNKYIRRKRKKCPHAYNMMYNCDLMKIPLETLLNDDGIVVVWCTNSPQHLKSLIDTIFPKWGIQYVGKWFWLKVTMFGEPVCEFLEPPGKQPFEQIIFGFKNPNNRILPTNGKLLVSIPSAIHSHKPPLVEVLQPFLPKDPKCLEIFARYLLPDWTSYGNEVLRFQHESLYVFKDEYE